MSKPGETFRKRLRGSELLVGTFLKTPSPIIAEVLARSTLDVHCIDAEHAPFGRLELDSCIAALRAAGVPVLVRVPGDSPHDIRNALDSGATGILVPHVTSAAQARAIVKAAHYCDGGRGYAGSTRAAEFTLKNMANHLADSREQTTVIVQIEDIAALDKVAEIAAVDGVDALFIGRIDLAVAMGKSVSDGQVIAAVRTVCGTSKKAGTAVGMFTPDLNEIPDWIKLGTSLFMLSSDQSFILAGANTLAERVRP
jgi:2-keto-3-deoxy-L-rhamnonate aldolase RhmA